MKHHTTMIARGACPALSRPACPALSALLLLGACAQGTAPGSDPAAGDRTVATRVAALEIYAPGDGYVTIQEAIDDAQPGDTVIILDGAHEESLILKSGVIVEGESRDGTVLYGGISAGAPGPDGPASLGNLTLDGSLAGGGTGIAVGDGSLSVWGVRVDAMTLGVDIAPSVGLAPESWPVVTIDRSEVKSAASAAVRVNGPSHLTLTNSLITYASSDGLQILGTADEGTAWVAHNVFFANGFGLGDGAAIWGSATGDLSVGNNIIISNNVGVFCSVDCATSHNVVWGNSNNWNGAAVAGPGNIHKDPRMSAPGEGDYSLLFDSPCVDAGDPSYGTETDHAGTDRPLGGGYDIGAFEYPATPPSLTLALTEVMANPLSEASGEYVELYNHGDSEVDAEGLVLDDGDSTDVLVGWDGGTTIIPAGGYALVLDPNYDGVYEIPPETTLLTVAGNATLGSGLSNADPVKLFASDGISPIDSYSFPFDAGNGTSVEKDELGDGDVLGNWVASPCGKSPGAENCASQPTNVSTIVLLAINEVMANADVESTGEFVEFTNFGIEPIDLEGLILSDGDSVDTITGWEGGSTILEPGAFAVLLDPDYPGDTYTIPESALLLGITGTSTLGNGLATNDPIAVLTPDGLSVIDTFTHTFDPGNGISVEKVAAHIADVSSNWEASPCGSSPGAINCITAGGEEPVEGFTIAIMEVMANPLDEDKDEYVELFNYGLEPVDIDGFRISDGDKEEKIHAVAEDGDTVVQPGGYALVMDGEYAGAYDIPEGTILMRTADTTIGKGLSTNDPVSLRAPTGAKKLDTYFFPFNPGNGVSAEKIDILIGDVAQNWIASPCKASPGANNCAATTGGASEAQVSPFSVVVSEVMANPLEESTGEYVELFNASPVGVDLAGWVLSDGDANDTIIEYKGGGTVLEPGHFAIIVDPQWQDAEAPYDVDAEALILTIDSTTLGNGITNSDPVTLYEADALTIVDTFSFPFNAGNGHSVEKVSLTGGDLAENWVTSPCLVELGDAADGSSPGGRNCADPYGDLNGTAAMGQPCPSGGSDCLSGLCAYHLITGESFCTADCSQDASDCPSGFSCDTVVDENYTDICVPLDGDGLPDVRINEILYDGPSGDSDDVFIELSGTPEAILDGMQLVAINGNGGKEYKAIKLTGQVGADGLFVIAHEDANPDLLALADQLSTSADLQNGPDSVQLRKGITVIDAVAYGEFDLEGGDVFAGEGTAAPGTATNAGESIGRVDDGIDEDDNSLDFMVYATPTPGAPNNPGI